MIVFTVIGVIVVALFVLICALWLLSWLLAKLGQPHKPYVPSGVKRQTESTNACANLLRASTDR